MHIQCTCKGTCSRKWGKGSCICKIAGKPCGSSCSCGKKNPCKNQVCI